MAVSTPQIAIDSRTTVGTVALTVRDLARSLTFYQEALGLKIHQQSDKVAHLGTGGDDLLILHENPTAKRYRNTTGLYHFALLVPSQEALARVLAHFAKTQTPLQGLSDHYVSEAIYLADPDGNGIEIYRDRPRDTWNFTDDNSLHMGTVALDVDNVFRALDGQDPTFDGLHPDTVMGHVHLHVDNISQAETFYQDILGFDIMVRLGGVASFASAGGYHHHLGFNTWAGVGAPPPPDDAVGLRWYQIVLPDDDALRTTLARLDNANIPINERDNGYFVRDFAQNGVLLVTK